MLNITSAEAVRELQSLIGGDQFGSPLDDPIQLAQLHLALAAKMLETAAFELARQVVQSIRSCC